MFDEDELRLKDKQLQIDTLRDEVKLQRNKNNKWRKFCYVLLILNFIMVMFLTLSCFHNSYKMMKQCSKNNTELLNAVEGALNE